MASAKIAFVFPGQGSQYAGMGKDIQDVYPQSKELFELADASLGFPLSKLCFDGPEDSLKETINSQPALLVTSLALYAAVQDKLPLPFAVAGHSLGEYSALVAADAFDFADAIRLVRRRGEAMETASKNNPGSMMAIIGLEAKLVLSLCEQAGAFVANYNSPGQIVVSGTEDALYKVSELAKEAKAKRVLPLNVSGAFHSPLMKEAALQLQELINGSNFRKSSIAVMANVNAQYETEPDQIKKNLVDQITGSVQWIKSIQKLKDDGVCGYIEFGPGKVLTGLIKRIDPQAELLNINNLDSLDKIEGFLEKLN